MSLVLGVFAVNALFLVVGFAPLAHGLRGASWVERASWSGVALLLGAGTLGTLLFFAAIAGFKITIGTAIGLSLCAAVVGLLLRPTLPRTRAVVRPTAAAMFGLLAAVCIVGIIGAFRSSPWLDDAWGIWLPKGSALVYFGLDERLFAPNGDYVTFGVPDYPLWWSAVTGLDMHATRGPSQVHSSLYNVDVRVMCAQLGLLVTAFIAATGRLLWGYVRPWVLAGALLLLGLTPELWRQVQGGGADVPLAIYLSLGVLAGALWLRTRLTFHLVLAGFALAVALQVKTEALPEVAALVAVGALFAPRLALAGVSLLFALPWLAWRWAHDVPSRAELDFSHLERIPEAARAVAEHIFDPTEWLVVVPLALVLALLARKPKALMVPGALSAVILTAYWIDRDEIGFVLATSAYRVIDPVVLSAAVLIPLLAESFLQQRQPLREDRALVGEP